MRKAKRTLAAAAALVMTLTFSAGALAASYDAGSWSDLETAFSDSSGEDVSVNLTADVDCNENTLSTSSGKSYTINTSNGSKLSRVGFEGSGSVKINADITGGLETTDSVSVTVNGDVENDTYNNSGMGVYAKESSAVTVNGDVTGDLYGVYATGTSSVTVNGDVAGKQYGVGANESAHVTVDGNVSGLDGNQSKADLKNPYSYADGGDGVYAKGNSVVSVSGNVTGGNSYGTYADGAHAVIAENTAEVSVGGNATGGSIIADPSTMKPLTAHVSTGGSGVKMDYTAAVTVGGNATGGNSNANQSAGGNGVQIDFDTAGSASINTTEGSLTVSGSATGGKVSAEAGGTDGDGVLLNNPERKNIAQNLGTMPTLSVGAYDSIKNNGFSENDAETLLDKFTVTGLPSEAVQAGETDFWQGIYWKISKANKGDKITIKVGSRTVIPAYIIEAACEYGVTLIIRWDGGNDIIINKPCKIEGGRSFLLLSDLAELYSK